MKFSIGDPVFVKTNEEEGIIEEFIGKDMANVRVGKGSYFVYLNDLEHPYLRWFTEKKAKPTKPKIYIDQITPEKNKLRQSGLGDGMFLVIMPIYSFDEFDEKVEKVKIYLYNETIADYNCYYQLQSKQENQFSLEFESIAGQEFYVHDIDFDTMATNPLFSFRFVDKLNAQLDNEFQVNLKPKKLFEQLDKIKFDNKAFFNILVFESLKPRTREEKIILTKKESKSNDNKSITHFNFQHTITQTALEIDLHIEKLVPNYQHLAPSEMLFIQLKECQKALDLAYATRQHMVILIHGIGKGKLKSEIHSLLNQTNWIERYVFEYDQRYGYGATKVFFKH